jgi:hypothetical protein
MPAHRIRLGPPWDASPDGTRHARRFGRPRTLGPGERVWLVCPVPPGATVSVNRQPVDPVADITPFLQPRNELVVVLPAAGEVGGVALEIRSGAELSEPGQNPPEPAAPPES